jgi:hypothetical protein
MLGPFSIGGYSVSASLPMVLIMLGMVVAWYWLLLRPIIRIIQRIGYSGWWVLLFFVPLGNVIGLWILAYGRWPAVPSKISN